MNKPRSMKNFFSKGKALVGAAVLAAIITGCGDSREDFVITNTNPIVIPAAADDNFAALGNATLNQAAANGVLTNDVVNGAAISAFDAVGSQGGTIVLNADGSFTYTPVAGFVGAETFNYTLTNNAGSSTATVTLTSTALGRFVDNSQAQNGTGTQAAPFNNLADAVNVAQNGDTIFVARGDGTNNNLTGAINLPAGVNLIGEGAGLVAAQTIVPAGQQPVITGPINCGGDNTISGFTIAGSSDDAIVIDGVGNVTVTDNILENPGDGLEYIDCDNSTGTVSVTDNLFQDPAGGIDNWLSFNNTDTNGNLVVTGNNFDNPNDESSDDMFEVNVNGTSVMDINISDNVADGDFAGEFDFGIWFNMSGTAEATVTVADNFFDNFDSVSIDLNSANGCTLSGTVSGNTVTNSGAEGMDVRVNNGTMSILGNIISDVSDDGILLSGFDLDGTFIVSNNNITNVGDDSIDVEVPEGNLNLALRNNTTSNSGNEAVVIDEDGNGDGCFEIFGNTFDSNLLIINNGTGTYSVERLNANEGGPLDAQGVNTFTGGAPSASGGGTINSVAAGFCQIP